MNINGISSSVRGFDLSQRKTNVSAVAAAFGQQLSENMRASSKQANTVNVRLPGENCIFSGGRGMTQSVYVEYTKDSTPENPIVRITGMADSGAFDYTMRIRDIDPTNANYAEMCALYGHQREIGAISSFQTDTIAPVPVGTEVGDFMQRRNYMEAISSVASSDMFSSSINLSGEEFLKLYKDYIENSRNEAEKAAEHEALMAAVDSMLDDGDSIDFKEVYERLSATSRDTLNDLKDGEDVTQDAWEGFLLELKNLGVITKEEFVVAKGDVMLIPLGYRDENGELVMYDGIAERFGMLDKLRTAPGGGIGMLTDTADTWAGDPLDFLDAWIENLTEWREELSRQRSEDGTPRYEHFKPIDDQIASCERVSSLVNGLLACAGAGE